MKIVKTLLGLFLFFILVLVVIFYYGSTIHKKLKQGKVNTEFVSDTIPFTYSKTGHILIEVNVNGDKDKSFFILDSGASNFIFPNYTDTHELPNNGKGFGISADRTPFFTDIKKIQSIQIGKAKFTHLNAEAKNFNASCSEKICGLIGTGIMQHLVWTIDFEKQIIILSKELKKENLSKNSIEIPLKRNKHSNHLYTNIQLRKNKPKTRVIVDLGNSGTLLMAEKDITDKNLNLKQKKYTGFGYRGLSNEKKKYNGIEFLADSLHFKNSELTITNFPISTSKKAINLLGLGFFKHYKTTISWEDKKMILEPYEEMPNFLYKIFGFSPHFDKKNKTLRIERITEDTPAARQELPIRGTILSVNDVTLENISYCDTEGLFKVDTLNMKVKNGNNVTEYHLVAEPIFE